MNYQPGQGQGGGQGASVIPIAGQSGGQDLGFQWPLWQQQ